MKQQPYANIIRHEIKNVDFVLRIIWAKQTFRYSYVRFDKIGAQSYICYDITSHPKHVRDLQFWIDLV